MAADSHRETVRGRSTIHGMSGYRDLPLAVREAAEAHLTRKQLDVFKLWVGGYSTSRIARTFLIAEPTAREHKDRAIDILRQHVKFEDIAA